MLVIVVMAAAVMATTVMATTDSCARRLAGAGQVVTDTVRSLGCSRLPGPLQHLQLQALLTSRATERHPAFPGYCVHLGRLHGNTPLWGSRAWWVLCGEASLNRQSAF